MPEPSKNQYKSGDSLNQAQMTRLNNWVGRLGKYQERENEAKKPKDPDNAEQVLAYHQDIKKREALRNNEKYKKALYENGEPDSEPNVSARVAFLRYLAVHVDNITQASRNQAHGKRVSLEELLDEDGLKKYIAAIKEEGKSSAFRDAVFSASTKRYEGPEWENRLILHVGGPSASGKSFGAGMLVEEMSKNHMDTKPNGGSGNYVVSIDGGVEREVSQMRQMVLQFALASGYQGISDLNKLSKQPLSVKSRVHKTAHALELSEVIPATYTKDINPINAAKTNNLFKHYAKDDNVVQAFSMIEGSKVGSVIDPETNQPDPDSTFRNQVGVMGSSRAWHAGEPLNPEDISMDNKAPCESKKYHGEYFKKGVEQSQKAKKEFITAEKSANKNQKPLVLTFTSDLIHLKRDGPEEDWELCTPGDVFNNDDPNMLRLNASQYNEWLKQDKLQRAPLEAFIKTHKPAEPISGPQPTKRTDNSPNRMSRKRSMFINHYKGSGSSLYQSNRSLSMSSIPTVKAEDRIDDSRAASINPSLLDELKLKQQKAQQELSDNKENLATNPTPRRNKNR